MCTRSSWSWCRARILSQRIARGAVPLDEALAIAKQIAEALEAAHEQGIIHRDLKPANIRITPGGAAKVLDFGLAKLVQPEANQGHANLTASPTITSPAMMTGVGVLLGTAAYMSPEQAKGREADKRSDIWAFGCVVYEMLTGKRAFEGEDVADTLANVLKTEPDSSALPPGIPSTVVTLLRRCLTKNRKRRLDSVADARLEIDDALAMPALDGPTRATPAPRAVLWRRAAAAVAVCVIVLAAGYLGWTLNPAEPRRITRLAILLPEGGDYFTNFARHLVALSPDGTRLVYAANNRLYLRALDKLDAAPVPGIEGTGPRAREVRFSHRMVNGLDSGRTGGSRRSPSAAAPRSPCVERRSLSEPPGLQTIRFCSARVPAASGGCRPMAEHLRRSSR